MRGGFTLIELMISITLMAIIGLGVLLFVDGSLRTHEQSQNHMERLTNIQRAWRIIHRDVTQISHTTVRTSGGISQPLLAIGSGEFSLAFTRAGWANPARVKRATIQRVAYKIEEGVLYRYYWPILSGSMFDTPQRQPLLSGIEQLEVRLFDGKDDRGRDIWATKWFDNSTLPKAVEIRLEFSDIGSLSHITGLATQ